MELDYMYIDNKLANQYKKIVESRIINYLNTADTYSIYSEMKYFKRIGSIVNKENEEYGFFLAGKIPSLLLELLNEKPEYLEQLTKKGLKIDEIKTINRDIERARRPNELVASYIKDATFPNSFIKRINHTTSKSAPIENTPKPDQKIAHKKTINPTPETNNDNQKNEWIASNYQEHLSAEEKQETDEIEYERLKDEIRKQNNGTTSQKIGLLLLAIGVFGILGGLMGASAMWAISPLVGVGYLMMTSG